MAKLTIKNVKLTGCSVVLGEDEHLFENEPYYYGNKEALLSRLKKTIGFGTRYTAKENTTTCDLCEQAANSLMQAMGLLPADIGGIISVTQTPDYTMPGNAHVLHERLQLSHDAPAVDVTSGCSGFVYGLWLAAMMASSGMKRVLLVAGDTFSKIVNKNDNTAAPIFGDAGSATCIEFSPTAQDMHFILHTDGSRVKNMYIPAGGCRTPSSPETRRPTSFEGGGMRSEENFYMDGFEVFEFTLMEQPVLLQEILAFSGKKLHDIDYFLLHQANLQIVNTIIQKVGLPPEKTPSDVFSRFGNLSSASIPAILCGSFLEGLATKKLQTIMQGFGVGLSWGACQLELDHVVCLPPICYKSNIKDVSA